MADAFMFSVNETLVYKTNNDECPQKPCSIKSIILCT